MGVGYGAPYYGWYDGYYYPGTGYYVYDRKGRAIAGAIMTVAIGKGRGTAVNGVTIGAAITTAATIAAGVRVVVAAKP